MEASEQSAQRPLWRKVWEFPLTAMLVAIAVIIGIVSLMQISYAYSDGLALPEETKFLGSVLLLVVLSAAAYKLIIRRLGGKKHDDLPLAGAFKDTALGFVFGGMLISICVALAAAFGVYRIEGSGEGTDLATIVLLTGVYAGFFEELLIRGIILRWLEEMTGSWIALGISSLIFGFGHAWNDNATVFSSVAIAIEAGILLGGAYMLTRSLWLAIGIHAGWNVVQGLWDVPVSGNDFDGVIAAELEGPSLLAGGGFGLEATIFALVVATGAGVWMLVLAARKGRIVKPMWSRKGEPITAY
uniref:CPBP family intramembrane glutamic endopeptidase n=1 Tax=Parerythrobacter lutipelagi TaxID=1964208 RepID=UPI0010F98596|nr:type II CAAX endopeptidase family protein [Parerythrobacter lutipelagi]